jgi:hypothetical protein
MRRVCTTNKGHALGVRVGISDKSGYKGHMLVFSGHTTEKNGHYNGHASENTGYVSENKGRTSENKGRASENKGRRFRKIRVTLFGKQGSRAWGETHKADMWIALVVLL